MGVYRQPARVRPHAGVRTLTWRQPGPQAGYPNLSIQGVLYAGAGLSLQQGVTGPPVQVGDTFLVSNTAPGNYVVIVLGDGTIQVLSGGDASRQKIQFRLYRRITGQFDSQVGTVWVNEQAPIWTSVPIFSGPFALALGVPMVPTSLAGFPYAQSPSGDTLTFSLASGSLPPGITLLSNGVFGGTPTSLGSYSAVFRAVDITGQGTNSPTLFIQVIRSVSFSSYLATIEGLSALNIPVNPVITYAYSSTVPDGYVISQNPPAGSTISPGSSVQVTVSMGPANPSNSTSIPNVVGSHVYFAQNAIVAAFCEVGTITYQISSTIAAAYVISQSPVARGPVPLWEPVNLVVSSGPPQTFPNTANPVVPPLP